MKPRLKSTRAARELIKAYEPFHGEAVRRGKRWVVGYGHTAAARPGLTLSREDAELLLIYDVLQAETAVHAALGEDLAEPVRDALVSFAASVGLNAFKVSDVARLAKSGRLDAAAGALETWVRAEEDGRLVTSERLVKRRAAEKSLLLASTSAQVAPPAEAEPAPQEIPEAAEPSADAPAAEPAAEASAPAAEPAAQETPDEAGPVEPDATPESGTGPLIDVDIAFEEPEEAAAPEAQPESEPEPEPVVEAGASGDSPEDAPESAPVEDEAQAGEAPALDTPEAPVEAESDVEIEAEPEPAAEIDLDVTPAETEGEARAVKAAQDAAIQAVMSRMAGEIAQSVSVTGVRRPAEAEADAGAPAVEDETPARDYGEVQLGYAFLHQDVIGIDLDEVEITTDQDEGAQDPAETEAVDAAESDSEAEAGEAEGPGRAVASPAPGPVYATVSVGPVEQPETAPPHPAEAPAAAPGMSGESEGPDHPEEGDGDEGAEDEAELEPAIVAGPEATYVADDNPPGAVERRGDWVHPVNIVTGSVLTGLGGWLLASEIDAYLAQGLSHNWLGPIAFGGGVLLLVSSGWVVVGRMVSKKD